MIRKEVLIVDDNEFIRASIVKYLRNHRLEVSCAKSVDEAINHLRHHHCDLLITDILMPEKDGFELVDAIRNSADPFHSIPIIAISGGGRTVDAEAALSTLEKKVDCILKKPFSKTHLLDTISVMLDKPSIGVAEVQKTV